MPVARSAAVLLIVLATLSGCTSSVSHDEAKENVLWGLVGVGVCLLLGWLFSKGDNAGAVFAAVAAAVVAFGLVLFVIENVVNIFLPEKKPGSAAFNCALEKGATVVTVQNTGSNLLVLQGVDVQYYRSNGTTLGEPTSHGLDLSDPPKARPGVTMTLRLSPHTGVGEFAAASCKVVGFDAVPT